MRNLISIKKVTIRQDAKNIKANYVSKIQLSM